MRSLLTILIIMLLVACGSGGSGSVSPELIAALAPEAPNPYDLAGDTAPDGGCVRLRSRRPVAPLGRLFNDSNRLHLAHARTVGIVPVSSAEDAWRNGRGLVRVCSNSDLLIDSLTHSYAYLTPRADSLLREIGRRFSDTLRARGGGEYRLKVTSLLRTDATVGRLRRVNRNATPESAHRYATTFDISYSKFICDNADSTRRTFEDLKNLLAEIIDDMRSQGRCLVKRERRQACFHITVTAPNE